MSNTFRALAVIGLIVAVFLIERNWVRDGNTSVTPSYEAQEPTDNRPSASSMANADIVYSTNGSHLYHRWSCRIIAQYASPYESTYKEAIADGYSACSTCNPPRPADPRAKDIL